MADNEDTFDIARRATAWSGDIEQLNQLCDSIAAAAFDRKEYVAVQNAATTLLANTQLPSLHQAQALLYLVSFAEDDTAAAEHLPKAEEIIRSLENISIGYGLSDARVPMLRNQAVKFRDYFTKRKSTTTGADSKRTSPPKIQDDVNHIVLGTSIQSKVEPDSANVQGGRPLGYKVGPAVVQDAASKKLPARPVFTSLTNMPKRQPQRSSMTATRAATKAVSSANVSEAIKQPTPSRIPSYHQVSPRPPQQLEQPPQQPNQPAQTLPWNQTNDSHRPSTTSAKAARSLTRKAPSLANLHDAASPSKR